MAAPIQVVVPDIGGFKDVDVIEVLVKAGQQIEKEAPLITLETEKAAMDVPAPAAGRVAEVRLKQGDKVSEGSLILLLEPAERSAADSSGAAQSTEAPGAAPSSAEKPSAGMSSAAQRPPAARASTASAPSAPQRREANDAAAIAAPSARAVIDEEAFSKAYASPSVRRFARELGADLGRIRGSGPKERITQEDVKAYVKRLLAAPPAEPGSGLPKVPEVDFAKFGAVEVTPLSRIQLISGARLQAAWINLPHVTQHEEADITELEAQRAALKEEAARAGVKLTPLAFIVRACLRALKEFPRFNASLDSGGKNLVLKKYFHIGFAADTPNGLVVPVIRDADRASLFDLARSLGALSEKARAGKLTAAEMQGGSFTISSLGGIGGTSFTPIINAPEVAILGVSRSVMKPVFQNGTFVPRLMLPLSLSYDHRVIDGAEAARFVVFLSKTLSDPKALR
jgi:pyruvate dehydrogenase E2 component (dihydrolipoamide acetyltransferase)